jgi:3-deoxy-D-manno-octulosonic acid kinase
MRRGGWLAAVWRGRYPSTQRLVATLAASVEARARGVPTAAPVALIVASGFGGLARGAMAFAEIEDAEDLAHKMVRGAATRADLAATIDAVRAMHDVGVCHPDLNLGNILLRPRAGGPPETFIIDFDRATFTPGPLPFGARQAAVRRLERSCAKLTGASGPFGPGTEDFWYTAYAGGDADLARGLAFGRPAGRLTLAMHRLSWRRKTQ